MHAGYVTSHKHTHTQTHTHTHAHTGFVTFPLHQLLQCNASQCYVIIRRLPVVLRKVNRSVCPLIPRFDTSRILVFTVSTYEMFTRPDVCRTVHHFASWRINNQLDATQYVSGTSMPIIRSSRLCCWLPHCSFRSWFAVCWRLGAVRLE